MSDPHNIQRFIDAQHDVFEPALAELRSGTKQSHWMWFIFPQMAGLGLSRTSQHYGIASLDEARAYLEHPVLGPRLRDCVEALLSHTGERTAEQILGSIDAMKLRSSMTLFDKVSPNDIFAEAIHAFFEADFDERTLALLNSQQ